MTSTAKQMRPNGSFLVEVVKNYSNLPTETKDKAKIKVNQWDRFSSITVYMRCFCTEIRPGVQYKRYSGSMEISAWSGKLPILFLLSSQKINILTPSGKKLWITAKKWLTSFMMGTTSSITMQCLGKIVQRAPAVGAKMWCLSLFFSVCHAPSPERRAFEGCIVRTRIALRFIGRFQWGLPRFFIRDCSFRHAKSFSHSSQGGATIFAKLRSKIAKSLKIGGKVCAHHFV